MWISPREPEVGPWVARAGHPALDLTWNAQYRLAAVSTNAVVVEAYGYDPLGRRAYTATATSSGSVTNWHAYVGIHCVADLDAGGNVLRSYTWGPGIDSLLAMTVHGATETNTYYALTDHLGTVHALVSSVDSVLSVVESYSYDAWGNVLAVYGAQGSLLPASSLGNRFLFQGREHSFATGLTNFRARWYDPATGRWLSNDPIGISGGLNQYVFCGNDPVDYVDPSGLCEESPFSYEIVFPEGYDFEQFEIGFLRRGRLKKRSFPESCRDFLGSTHWSVFSHNSRRFRFAAPKCNEFVFDMIKRYNLPDPSVPVGPGSAQTRPPTASEWFDPSLPIPGWGPPHVPALPGDIVSDGNHVGVQTERDTRISASSRVNKVVENGWGQGSAGRSPAAPEP